MRPCARATWERVLCFGATDVWMFPVIRFGSVPEWQKPLAAQRRVQDRKLQILDEDFVAKPVRLTNLTYGTMNHKSLPLLLPLSVFSRRFFPLPYCNLVIPGNIPIIEQLIILFFQTLLFVTL